MFRHAQDMITDRHIAGLFTSLILLVLTACAPAEKSPNPMRTEFMKSCPQQKPYVNRDTDRVTRYCRCIYDKYTKGLQEDEKLIAQFYLMSQFGVDVQARPEFKNMDVDKVMIVINKMNRGVLCIEP